MKKNFFKALVKSLFMSSLVFAAAPAFASGNEGFYPDLDSGLAAAKKSDKGVLIFITQQGEDELSSSFMETVKSDEVQNQLGDYVLVGMDFSQAAFEKTVVRDIDTPENQQAAKKAAEDMQKNSRFAALINPEFTPAVYLFTAEGYYVSHLVLKGDENAEGFIAALKADEYKHKALRDMIAKTKTGKPLDKVAAIDEIFEATQPEYRFFLIDLVNTAISLDKKNKSGLMSKYIITRTEYDAMICFYDNNAAGAVNAYVNAAKEKFLSAEEKQQAYYMAALVMVKSSGQESLPMIITYLEKSLAAAPNSAVAPKVKENLDYFKDYQAKMNAAGAAGAQAGGKN
ncbi:hypothetical protein [Treponema sp. C6A8]|uniref:hypothetical protein n=1 Tax=Treponema sp. C6A8 TaxID=1410609 RepID=UPI000482E584|nr:hypothetical protein [Treponema sp. C6A8]